MKKVGRNLPFVACLLDFFKKIEVLVRLKRHMTSGSKWQSLICEGQCPNSAVKSAGQVFHLLFMDINRNYHRLAIIDSQ